jgi:lipopolysaccharide/colanic/teichoic acid biosynthesis glycosyltransferase
MQTPQFDTDTICLSSSGVGGTDLAGELLGTPRDVGSRVPLLTRLVEVCVVSIALIVLSPLALFIALIIRLGTPGPALFRQERVGLNLKPFLFCKFRTLYADARERFPKLYSYKYTQDQISILKFKLEKDPRVTPQGEWLRRSTLDELPNFWNVLTGEMALVGPRPEIPEMLPYYKGEMLKKFSVRPGITGLAQVSGRGRLTFLETVRYDLEYVEHRSQWLDLKILYLTVIKIFLRDGAF